jgi:hypothetical protein
VVLDLESVLGWLTAWLWAKARRVAGRTDAELDRGIDAGLDRLNKLISSKLGADPAIARLTEEVGQNLDAVSTSVRTRQRVLLALEELVDADTEFATQLADVVAELRELGTPSVGVVTATGTGPARATGGGVAISGAVGGDVSTGGR